MGHQHRTGSRGEVFVEGRWNSHWFCRHVVGVLDECVRIVEVNCSRSGSSTVMCGKCRRRLLGECRGVEMLEGGAVVSRKENWMTMHLREPDSFNHVRKCRRNSCRCHNYTSQEPISNGEVSCSANMTGPVELGRLVETATSPQHRARTSPRQLLCEHEKSHSQIPFSHFRIHVCTLNVRPRPSEKPFSSFNFMPAGHMYRRSVYAVLVTETENSSHLKRLGSRSFQSEDLT